LASYAHVPVDPKKAESLTKDSFTATEAIEDPPDKDQCGQVGTAGDIKSWIQERVLSEMVQKGKSHKPKSCSHKPRSRCAPTSQRSWLNMTLRRRIFLLRRRY